MKVCIAYPPLDNPSGTALLSQNRQFQWSRSKTVIYPVIAASAATLLDRNGYEVCWLDGIAERWTYEKWLEQLVSAKPDLIFLESKTPVIKRHWKIIKTIKKKLPDILVVLAGDHVSALPEESFHHSPVDYIITGGHYDFLLFDLVNHLTRNTRLNSAVLTGNKQKTGPAKQAYDLNTLPVIDRDLTKWKLYASNNGNFKYTPGAYIMAGRDCWWRRNGGCRFCSWTSIFPQFTYRSVNSVLDEIGQLIDLGACEIFDDTGTFMVGEWLRNFCKGMIKRGYNKKVTFGCNMRFGYLNKQEYALMAKAGFRFILYGLESANQKTLDRLNKGTVIHEIEKELMAIKEVNAKTHGQLEPHVACMIGYPWESKADAENTVRFCKKLFQDGLIHSLQGTLVIPYPGTTLFEEAEEKGWLTTNNWDDYDMKTPVLKTPIAETLMLKLTRNIYLSVVTPEFVIRKLLSIRSANDIKILAANTVKFASRIMDFSS